MDPLEAQGAEASVQKREATEEPTLTDFVAKEKYCKLKRRFKALKDVSD